MTLDREIAISVQRCMLWGIQKLLLVCFQVAGNEIVSPGHRLPADCSGGL